MKDEGLKARFALRTVAEVWMKWVVILAVVVLGLLLWRSFAHAAEMPKAGQPAPAFSLPDLKGRNATLAELRGKVVMLFFWATW